jgi:hypothetical protein
MTDSVIGRCFDCGRDVPTDQTIEFEFHGPERVPNPQMARVRLECWNAAKDPATPARTGLVCPKRAQPVAVIDPANPLLFRCPACGHEWTGRAN